MKTDADLRVCGLAELEQPAGSIDLVLTDPPYPAKFDPLLADLAALCAHGLRDGGSALVMLGHRQIPAAIAAFAAHPELVYRWVFMYDARGGGNGRCWPLKLWTVWKPIVWWSKGPVTRRTWREDRIFGVRSKVLHKWQQGTAPFVDLALSFSAAGDLVCDPFLGAGTTAVAAALTGRRFLGCDVDDSCIRKTKARLDAVDEFALASGALLR